MRSGYDNGCDRISSTSQKLYVISVIIAEK